MIDYEFLLQHFMLFVFILIRIASFLFVAPIFNTANTPNRVKVGLAFFVTAIVYNLHPEFDIVYHDGFGLAAIVLKEVLIGLILGAITGFCVQIIMFAGKIIDMDTGLAMAMIMDPTTNNQVGILGNLYYYILLLLLLVSGLHRYLLEAIAETFNVIPIGSLSLSTSVYDVVIKFMTDYFIIGFRIALPVFTVTLILNVVLAIIARVAPQMNMFVVGMQLKIFGGIIAIFITIVMMPAVATFIEETIHSILGSLVRGMS